MRVLPFCLLTFALTVGILISNMKSNLVFSFSYAYYYGNRTPVAIGGA